MLNIVPKLQTKNISKPGQYKDLPRSKSLQGSCQGEAFCGHNVMANDGVLKSLYIFTNLAPKPL